MNIKQLLGNYSERKFKNKFPDLKQVVNNREYDFGSSVNVPLNQGENTVFLQEGSAGGRRSVYTTFFVDMNHNYGFRLVYNYLYISEKVSRKYLVYLLLVIALQVVLMFLISISPLADMNYFLKTIILFIFGFTLVYQLSNKAIHDLGISAYKIEVNSIPK